MTFRDHMTPITIEDTNLPEEYLLDEGNPANDKYIQDTTFLEQQIMHVQRAMRPRHVQICKHIHTGTNNIEIADKLHISTATVSKIKNSPLGKRLLSLLAFYQVHKDGASHAQRRNMLWRIAVDNKENRPATAISAITELNKMDATAAALDLQSQGLGTGKIEIHINQDQFPKGQLD